MSVDSTLGELKARDFDNFQHILKKATIVSFPSREAASLFHLQCMAVILAKHGIEINIESDPAKIDDTLKAKQIRIENRTYPDIEYNEMMVQKYINRDKEKPFQPEPLPLPTKHNKEKIGKYISGIYIYKGNTEEIYKDNEMVGFVSSVYSSPLLVIPTWFVRWIMV